MEFELVLSMVKKISRRMWLFIINVIVLLLSMFIPKTSKIVILGGWTGQRFADNSRYLFLYLNKYKSELNLRKVVWITRKKNIRDELRDGGYISCLANSLSGGYYHLRAKYHFIDWGIKDINPFFSVRTKRVNLWHGIPLKKIGYLMEGTADNSRQENKFYDFLKTISSCGFWNDSHLLVPSPHNLELFRRAFNKSYRQLIVANYPRVDYLRQEEDYFLLKAEVQLRSMLESLRHGNRLLAYLPTFRDNRELTILGAEGPGELKKFDRFLADNDLILLVKMHFAEKMFQRANVEVINRNNEFNHIIFVPPEADVYSFLKFCDLLITDYSSVYYDFLALNRPIIFFPFDYNYYANQDRGFAQVYENATPGDKVRNLNELKKSIIENLNFPTKYEDERQALFSISFDLNRAPGYKFIMENLDN